MEENQIVFKTEDSVWQMMAEGKKPWDARRWDLEDERIRRLASGKWIDASPGAQPYWAPTEALVSFVNKATGELLVFRYLDMVFQDWAPGWVFLKLGGLTEHRGLGKGQAGDGND